MKTLKKLNSLSGLLITIVILSGIMCAMVAIAKSNVITHRYVVEKIDSLEELHKRLDGEERLPEGIEKDKLKSIEVYEETGIVHILCDNSEVAIEDKEYNTGYIDGVVEGRDSIDIEIDGLDNVKYIKNKEGSTGTALTYEKGNHKYIAIKKGNLTVNEMKKFIGEQ